MCIRDRIKETYSKLERSEKEVSDLLRVNEEYMQQVALQDAERYKELNTELQNVRAFINEFKLLNPITMITTVMLKPIIRIKLGMTAISH